MQQLIGGQTLGLVEELLIAQLAERSSASHTYSSESPSGCVEPWSRRTEGTRAGLPARSSRGRYAQKGM